MERIHFTRLEQRVLYELLDSPSEVAIKHLQKGEYNKPLKSLRSKKFIALHFNGEHIDRIILLPKFYDYYEYYGNFKNPFNWQLCQLIVTIILTIATIIGLFIGCTILKLQ